MTADAAAANYDDERLAELVEALRCKEDAITGELFEDQLIVKVAGLRASGQGFGSKVLFVGGRNGSEARQLSRQRELLVISDLVTQWDQATRVQAKRKVEPTYPLERMLVAWVWNRVLESGHAQLVRQALVAQQTRGHNATRDDSGGRELDTRVRARARQEAGHFDRSSPDNSAGVAGVLPLRDETSRLIFSSLCSGTLVVMTSTRVSFNDYISDISALYVP